MVFHFPNLRLFPKMGIDGDDSELQCPQELPLFHMKFETFVPNIDELFIGHIVYKSCSTCYSDLSVLPCVPW